MTISATDKKLGLKWVDPYNIKERRPVHRYEEENGLLGSPGPERERGPERQHGEEGDEQQMTADKGPRYRELAGEASDRPEKVTSGEEMPRDEASRPVRQRRPLSH